MLDNSVVVSEWLFIT